MNVEAVLKQKRLWTTKRQFSYEAPDEGLSDALKKMEISFFNVLVDVSIASLQERFQTLGWVEKNVGELVNFPDLPNDELKKQWKHLARPELQWPVRSGLEGATGEETQWSLSKYVGDPEDSSYYSNNSCYCRKELLQIEAHQNIPEIHYVSRAF